MYLRSRYVNAMKINGAHNRIRTGDLFLTMEALYLLSYGSKAKESFRYKK